MTRDTADRLVHLETLCEGAEPELEIYDRNGAEVFRHDATVEIEGQLFSLLDLLSAAQRYAEECLRDHFDVER